MSVPTTNNPWLVDKRDARSPRDDINGVRLLWTDPPFGTGKSQRQRGREYYDGVDTAYILNALPEWIPHLARNATVCVCCDYRLVPAVVNVLVEEGLTYQGEIVWTFGLGRPRTNWWPVRHNNILTFTGPHGGLFDRSAVPVEPRRASGAVGDRPRGSVWDFTMSNNSGQRVGYPNQKPIEIIEPFVLAHTKPGDLVVDPFCGSSSTGVAALKHGRRFYGSDTSPDAVDVSRQRLGVMTEKIGFWSC